MYDLFNLPVAEGKTDTSKAAAAKVTHHVRGLRLRVLDYVRNSGEGGATLSETTASLEWIAQSISARFTELKALGLVRDTGHRRNNSRGNREVVYAFTGHHFN